VLLDLIDDCLSKHTCSTGDGEPKICNEPHPYFDATISVSPFAADGTFTVQLDLGGEYAPQTCAGGPHEVCWDDGQQEWCGQRIYAPCGGGALIVDRTTIELWFGGIVPDGCSDVYRGTVVP